ncbi:MAG TPA: hypothetical protein VLZ82_06995 [Microbacterium sp.]|nr:hypothetical protein [Microbacterium sp.]
MAEKQVPVTESSVPSAPPSLQLIETDAAAGVCVDGYCVLPAVKRAPSDG